MNWYKTASLIDTVVVPACSGGHLVLMINSKRYEYSGVPGTYWNGEITRWKTWKNKRAAGEKISNLIRNLNSHLAKDPNSVVQPKIQKTDKGLFDELV